MAYEAQKPNNIKSGSQIDLDFSKQPEKTFEQERAEMANKLGLLDESKLTKKDDTWYVGNLTSDEYLDAVSGNDNRALHDH